jgi:hypothetical protein
VRVKRAFGMPAVNKLLSTLRITKFVMKEIPLGKLETKLLEDKVSSVRVVKRKKLFEIVPDIAKFVKLKEITSRESSRQVTPSQLQRYARLSQDHP